MRERHGSHYVREKPANLEVYATITKAPLFLNLGLFSPYLFPVPLLLSGRC